MCIKYKPVLIFIKGKKKMISIKNFTHKKIAWKSEKKTIQNYEKNINTEILYMLEVLFYFGLIINKR